MFSRRATLIAVAALAAVGAGCGSDTNAPTTDAARTQAEQVVEGLSPQARDLLRDAEALAGRTSAAARGYAEGDLAPDQASTRLEEYADQAEQLGQKAQGLPESDPARQQIIDLADETRSTAEELRETADAGAPANAAAVEDRLRDLQQEGRRAFDRYRDELPAQARDEIGKAVDELVAP
jgi:Ribonuclease G/E